VEHLESQALACTGIIGPFPIAPSTILPAANFLPPNNSSSPFIGFVREIMLREFQIAGRSHRAGLPDGDPSATLFPVAPAELSSSLAHFVTSEAQLFLDHFFPALDHGGVQEAGAALEFSHREKARRLTAIARR
jgi:hypothetical protein